MVHNESASERNAKNISRALRSNVSGVSASLVLKVDAAGFWGV